MAPCQKHTVASVLSTQVLSHNESSILVEAGGFTPMGWFFEHGLRPNNDEAGDEPPRKRRKTEETTKPQSARADPIDINLHIPISRLSIDLHFPETLHTKAAKRKAVEDDVEFDEEESICVFPSIVNRFDDGHRLKLVLCRKKGAILVVDLEDIPDATLQTLRKEVIPRMHRTGEDVKSSQSYPATWARCILTRSHGQLYTVVRLQATIYWRTGASAFAAGAPVGKTKVYGDYDALIASFPDAKRIEADNSEPWTPQDFYNSVHVPDKDILLEANLAGLLESELYAFQRRAVHWMLAREGVRYRQDGSFETIPQPEVQSGLTLSEAVEDIDGKACNVNHLQGILKRDPNLYPRDGHLLGGILAEEMGLGKTVELIALLGLNRRKVYVPDTVLDADSNTNMKPSRATLIITPASILQQWRTEIARHAPALKVKVYEGISRYPLEGEDELFGDLTLNYDVILTTYHTLAREVHFAEDPPDRARRAARKYERRTSPLIHIQWWRVCLDEAQMVESGVTAAARVACRLPRVHSWAVSGTPLRKDVQDLHGLLVFLRYKPLSDSSKLWNHLVTNHKHLFGQIFGEIALRHTKAQIKEDLSLPPQKRVVINVPSSAIEEQHYSTLFAEMCDAVGVNEDGSPKEEGWDPADPGVLEAMRTYLSRLRQTCLHPSTGARNRKALGRGQGPLRTAAQVLEVMIDQNETAIRTQERAVLELKLKRGHIWGNAEPDERRSENALKIYLMAMQVSESLVKIARNDLAAAKEAHGETETDSSLDTDDEDSTSESTPILGRSRNNLRTFLELHHKCTFFAATAYFQIKTNENLIKPDSAHFRQLEEQEVKLYEAAKLIRKEVLKQTARRAEGHMRKIQDIEEKDQQVKFPSIKDLESLGGIESRRLVEKSDDLFDVLREQASVLGQWRTKMAEYLLKPLVDVDSDGMEITGDEYEDSTKLQDELYAYFDATKAMQADLNSMVTGEDAPLIDHEVKMAVRTAKSLLDNDIIDDMKSQVHAPELTLELLATRNELRAKKEEAGSVRGLIQEMRGLETSLQGYETGFRAVERTLVRRHLNALQSVFSAYTKTLTGLEKEIDLFRSTQNHRLEFYKQLQELSDSVKPYKEELDPTLDVITLNDTTKKEEKQADSLARTKTQNRYLRSLRDDQATQDEPRICVICRSSFEIGVLTTCGHQFCKECIQHWWRQASTCPVCKRHLNPVDCHNITYKPQEIRASEEVPSDSSSPADSSTSSPSSSHHASIYSGIDTELLLEIKAVDLPKSYGTKIDFLGRHLHWLRSHDPGAKSIIFSQYREFLDVLGLALNDFKIGYARLGRRGAVEKFKHDPSIDCLLLDAKTDSSGLTLVNATHVFMEPLMQTAMELQAIARVHRIGQTRPTTVWMYLVNGTVEESVYEMSVARRVAHVQSRQDRKTQKSRSATPAPLQAHENAIELANSEELQNAPVSKLMVAGKGGGEIVGKDDLWQCLFGKAGHKQHTRPSVETETVVARHLRAEAAEQRQADTAMANNSW